MSDTKYNGWTNYESWLVNLWIDNDGSSDYWRERAEKLAQEKIDADDTDDLLASVASDLADEIKDQIEEQSPAGVTGMYADLLNAALSAVDWREIAYHVVDHIEVYSAGWNMPGYMPDNAPMVFLSSDDALEYIKDEATRAIADLRWTLSAYEQGCEAIDSWEADKNGEFGATFGEHHYFVTRI